MRIYSYDRRTAASPLDAIEDTLEALKALDANLDGIEQAFDAHFRTAGLLDPEVESQLTVLVKAREGLKAAKTIQEQIDRVIGLYPDDKAAVKSRLDADRMVKRFEKHVAAAHKIVETISKKAMPPALKRESAVAVKAIQDRLVNPDGLEVIPWQRETDIYVPPTTSWGRGNMVKVVEYQVVFKLTDSTSPERYGKWLMWENSGNAQPGVFGGTDSGGPGAKTTITGKEFAERFLAAFRGWPGIKGEAEASKNRASTAQAVSYAINMATRAMRSHDLDRVEVSKDNITIRGGYRSWHLPKEGESDVGETRYRAMVDDEIGEFRKVLDQKLSAFKGSIERIDIYDGEKSWVHVEVTLK